MAALCLDRLPVLVKAQGALVHFGHHAADEVRTLLPGSFHPVHDGHWGLAQAAASMLGTAVTFELSIVNVDKPELAVNEVERRVAPFAGRADVWITRAPRFLDKAAFFPGATFVVGADTALRLIEPRYYGNDPSQMLAVLDLLRSQGCRFLVAGRLDAAGTFVRVQDLPIPGEFRALFTAISDQAFRWDVSSTALRARP
jgi:hypothetical protein